MELKDWANHKLWASVRGDFLDWCRERGFTSHEEPWRLYATYAHWARLQEAKRAKERAHDNPRRTRRAPWASGSPRRRR